MAETEKKAAAASPAATDSKAMSSRVIKCDCAAGPAASFQDAEYGKGMRLHTIKIKGESRTMKNVSGFVCTVCGKVKSSR